MSNPDEYEYDLETEGALSGFASLIARGHGPRQMAAGLVDLFNSTDEQNRWRRRELAKIFCGAFQRVAESDHPDAEGFRNLAAKLREIELANS